MNASLSPVSDAAPLAAPIPLEHPIRSGRVVRVPERWRGPLSGAAFEAVPGEGAFVALGVGLRCPRGRLKPGALWIPCQNGDDLIGRAKALDAALAIAGGKSPETGRGKIGGVQYHRILETLFWLEAGAAHGGGKGVWTTGAKSLFSEKARELKRALETVLPPGAMALAAPVASESVH